MKDYKKNMRLALVCFLLVVVLNFFLPRLLPGNPVAYLTGFSEQDMTPAQVAFYEEALHLNKPLAAQFGFYLRSLLDGTLGYSYKKDAAVSALIGEKIGYTLQITVIQKMTAYGQNRHEYKKRDTGPQHITPTGLFETDLVIMLPCYFSQPKQIVEEIIMSFLLFIFLFLHSKHNVRQPIAVYGNLFISLNYKYIS